MLHQGLISSRAQLWSGVPLPEVPSHFHAQDCFPHPFLKHHWQGESSTITANKSGSGTWMDQLYEGERIPECKSGSFRKKEEESKGGQLPNRVGYDQGQRGKAENPPTEVSCVPALRSYSCMRLP